MHGESREHLRKFMAPEFVFGNGSRDLAGQYAVNYGIRRLLLVTDEGLIRAGWVRDMEQTLREHGLEYVLFSEITPNPRDYEVMRGVTVYHERGCNGILALGGGSPMDAAKGIGIVAANGGEINEYEGVDEVPAPIPPLICVPTTAGTSADVSQFAIIGDTNRKTKMAIVSKAVVPDVALIDPFMTTTMDSALTAATGLDALTHAVEALASNAKSPVTDLNALEAVALVFRHLEAALRDPMDLVAREGMMLASLFAGLAFSNASLGAVHAMAHALGGLLDLPHGQCNAILLSHVMAENFDAATEPYLRMGNRLGLFREGMSLAEKKDSLLFAVQDLVRRAGVTQGLGDLGMKRDSLPDLVGNAMNDACLVTNPKSLSPEELQAIYEATL